MKAIIGYESDERTISSERFLSKDELRKIFGSGISVTLMITKQRKRMRKNHARGIGSSVKVNYPILKQKRREVHL